MYRLMRGCALMWFLVASSASAGSLECAGVSADQALGDLDPTDRARLLSAGDELRGDEVPGSPLILQQARRISLQSNPDIHATIARLEAARARIHEARSYYYPKIELNHNDTRTFQLPNKLSLFPSSFAPDITIPEIPQDPTLEELIVLRSALRNRRQVFSTLNTNSFSDHATALSVSWVLFDGFVRDARVASAKSRYRASAMALADVQRLLIQAVDTAYHRWLLGREEVRVSQADETFSREQLDYASTQYTVGKLTKASVLNFEVRVRAAQARVVAALGIQENAKVVLAELMALPEAHMPTQIDLPPLGEESDQELAPPDAGPWIGQAMQHRPDLQQAEYSTQAYRQNVRLAKGQFSPEISIRGSWGYESNADVAYSQSDQSSSIGVVMRWGLSTGGLRTSQVRRAKAELAEANATFQQVHLAVASDVRRAVVDVSDAQEQVKLRRLMLIAATENRRLVQSEYASGKASVVRLNDAQRDYVAADTELARARVQMRQAWSNLRTAAGVNLVDTPTAQPVADPRDPI